MLYSTLLVAAAAFSSFASAQNATTPNGPCCSVPASSVPEDERKDWCLGQKNTCRELCGGGSQVASNGNTCDDDSLDFTCKCQNGTSPNVAEYQQTVPAQMCFFWFGQCINATGDNLDEQQACKDQAAQNCGNKTTDADSTASASGSGSDSTATATGGSSSPSSTTTGGAASQSSGAAAALAVAREFGTPVLAGGLIALFGFAL